MSRYVKRQNGEGWEIRNREAFKISCCDCGLVHNIVIVAPGKRKGAILGIAAERNERATGQKRRRKNVGRGVLSRLEQSSTEKVPSLGANVTTPPLRNERPTEHHSEMCDSHGLGDCNCVKSSTGKGK